EYGVDAAAGAAAEAGSNCCSRSSCASSPEWRDMPCIAPKGVVFGAVGIHHAKNADPATMSAAGSVFA
ncbi:MAG: hypothetical protein OSW71_17025, partial [Proteobacteria bacterium]|nr:hypothetical protein [Pseudomonadota bacterium]